MFIDDKREQNKERCSQYYYAHKHDADFKAKRAKNTRDYRARNVDKLNKYKRTWRKKRYAEHRDEILAKNRRWKQNRTPEQVDAYNKKTVAWKAGVKREVLEHYSNGEQAACAVCGYNDIRALSIDHVNGGGRQHRESINGYHIYPWLRKNDYPEGFQVLCMNCQFVKKAEQTEYGKYAQEDK